MQRTAFTDGAELKINTTRRDTLDGAIKGDQVIRQVVKNGGHQVVAQIMRVKRISLPPALKRAIEELSWKDYAASRIDRPPKSGRGLGGFCLHLDRRDTSDGEMEPGSIVEALNEGEDITLGPGAGSDDDG